MGMIGIIAIVKTNGQRTLFCGPPLVRPYLPSFPPIGWPDSDESMIGLWKYESVKNWSKGKCYADADADADTDTDSCRQMSKKYIYLLLLKIKN